MAQTAPPLPSPGRLARWRHALRTVNPPTGELDAVYSRAVDAGAAVVSEIETRPWGERSFYCLDPDGNRLCFVDESTLFLGRGAEWA